MMITELMQSKVFMKKLAFLSMSLLLAACTTNPYALSIHSTDGEAYSAKGTVISVEDDGDFVMETHGKTLFVDVKDGMSVELGDRVIVGGFIDNDDDTEAAELDADRISDWSHGHSKHGHGDHDPHSAHPHHSDK